VLNSLTGPANALGEQGSMDDRGVLMQLSCAAKGGGREIDKEEAYKGVKLMGIEDRNGLPVAATTHMANH
jgi:hypothetical protein